VTPEASRKAAVATKSVRRGGAQRRGGYPKYRIFQKTVVVIEEIRPAVEGEKSAAGRPKRMNHAGL